MGRAREGNAADLFLCVDIFTLLVNQPVMLMRISVGVGELAAHTRLLYVDPFNQLHLCL